MPQAIANLSLTEAVEVFVRGFSAVRGRTHPFLVERLGPLWHLHDAPRRRKSDHVRRPEYVVLSGVKPASVLRRITAVGDDRFALCVIHDGQGRRSEVEEAYKGLGLRYVIHEPFFVRRLPPAPRPNRSPVPVARVRDVEMARLVARAARRAQISESDIADDEAAHRLYAAVDGEAAVGWVSSIRTHPQAAWVANLFVEPAHRGRGIGKALMQAMLRDDLSRGIHFSVLTASQAGARLYRRLKYDQIGTLQMFIPGKRQPIRAAMAASGPRTRGGGRRGPSSPPRSPGASGSRGGG